MNCYCCGAPLNQEDEVRHVLGNFRVASCASKRCVDKARELLKKWNDDEGKLGDHEINYED